MNQTRQKQGFTLVELIVVITILAILWTIAFISLEWYSKTARDSVRISDMSRIKTSVELFSLQTGKYPETTNWIEVKYQSDNLKLWNQWTFWTPTFNNVEKLDKIPYDPLTDKQYIYSVTATNKEYQLWWMLETNNLIFESINDTYALADEYNFRVIGNYNWEMLKVPNWNKTTILAVPSIITLCWTQIEEIVDNNYFLHDGYNRFPNDYNWVGTYSQCDGTWKTLVNKTHLVLFNWSTSGLVWDENKYARIDLVSNIQSAYIWTHTAWTNDRLISILWLDIENNQEAADLLWQGIVRGNINTSIISSWGSNSKFTDENYFTINSSWIITWYDKSWWLNIVIPDYINWIKVVWCSWWSFVNKWLIKITLPNWMTSIWENAFAYNNITEIKFSSNLESIWNGAFYWNKLVSVEIPKTVTSIWNNAFNNNNLISVYIPSSVTNIWTWAFYNQSWVWGVVYGDDNWYVYNTYETNMNNEFDKVTLSSFQTDYSNNGWWTWSSNISWWVWGWQAVDSNCSLVDIQIWNQIWAGCNSTIGDWADYWVSINNVYDWESTSCYKDYNWTNNINDCVVWTTEMSSSSKADIWFTWINDNWDSEVNNIWWKFYTMANAPSACSNWYHLPSIWEWTTLLSNLWCSDYVDSDTYWNHCSWLWWMNNNTKDSTNNLIKALKIPLSWFRDTGSTYFVNRWNTASFWSSSYDSISWKSIQLYYDQDYIHRIFRASTLWYNVRCIKDPEPVNWSCWTAEWWIFDTFPTENLCETWTSDFKITYSWKYYWSCVSDNWGWTKSCIANKTRNMENLFNFNTYWRGNEWMWLSWDTMTSLSEEWWIPTFTSKESFTTGKYYLYVDSRGCSFADRRYWKHYYFDFDTNTKTVYRADNWALMSSWELADWPIIFTLRHCWYSTHRCDQYFIPTAVSPDSDYINYLWLYE